MLGSILSLNDGKKKSFEGGTAVLFFWMVRESLEKLILNPMSSSYCAREQAW